MKQQLVPAVYAERPIGVSSKYTFIPTVRLIDDLQTLGWYPATIIGNRHSDVAKHLIRFRRLDISGDEVPEIVMVNSHDGLSSFRLMAGVFRLVCGNGLIIAESLFSAISIRHISYSYESVQYAVSEFVEKLPGLMHSVERFKSRELKIAERLVFAKSALLLRFPEKLPDIDLARFLAPRRPSDAGEDLWRTLNITQEKLLNGRFYDRSGNKIRPLRNVDRTVKLNQALFDLANSFAA
ncbi:DUF932 domain-containing protein [Turneriella parva]|uniref:DUF945 domain-containing protein n=1 Tax=Turneriella parva (strain ATCC BAA-1111 / DSM 21527 / NCTC 11395 / H) TaxID=869212 RepID=I4B1Q1_TURPD|nr:DUF932 domain-containing protein [Turneriella parva]AFM11208.1 protein of unknown function DUF932 [Turneriella parva DSM 21527]